MHSTNLRISSQMLLPEDYATVDWPYHYHSAQYSKAFHPHDRVDYATRALNARLASIRGLVKKAHSCPGSCISPSWTPARINSSTATVLTGDLRGLNQPKPW